MLPASVILENCCFGAFSDMEYIFPVGKSQNLKYLNLS